MPVEAYVWSLAFVAAGMSGHAILQVGTIDWPALLLLAAAAVIAERFDINLYGGSRISVSGLFLLTAAIALGPASIVFIAPLVAVAGHVGRSRPFVKFIFNASLFLATSIMCSHVFSAVARLPGAGQSDEAIAALLAGLTDFAISGVLVSLVIAATTGERATAIWREKFAWLAPHFLVTAILAFVLMLAYQSSLHAWGIVGFIAPVMLTRFTMKQYVDRTEASVVELHEKNRSIAALSLELQEAYEDTLAAFAAALDHRDTETHGHSTRVAEMSVAIGELLGIARGTQAWADLRNGAMLHDVGKIGVSDAILRKPGNLDEGEWAAIRTHPNHGYEMLRAVRFLHGAADLVLAHHERFDGKGYPRGLAGDDIPLAARIFAVADTFDAMTSRRPYKPARSVADAIAEIQRHSGTQFDPNVVGAFARLKIVADSERRDDPMSLAA